ncbi:hypothetical protein K353_06547 [Kitasatospora sp. SolWspMP-SS2h]|nr:hypothetical protein K353_06547 [Kitasatospora sp. SolWspMP-SS2h]
MRSGRAEGRRRPRRTRNSARGVRRGRRGAGAPRAAGRPGMRSGRPLRRPTTTEGCHGRPVDRPGTTGTAPTQRPPPHQRHETHPGPDPVSGFGDCTHGRRPCWVGPGRVLEARPATAGTASARNPDLEDLSHRRGWGVARGSHHSYDRWGRLYAPRADLIPVTAGRSTRPGSFDDLAAPRPATLPPGPGVARRQGRCCATVAVAGGSEAGVEGCPCWSQDATVPPCRALVREGRYRGPRQSPRGSRGRGSPVHPTGPARPGTGHDPTARPGRAVGRASAPRTSGATGPLPRSPAGRVQDLPGASRHLPALPGDGRRGQWVQKGSVVVLAPSWGVYRTVQGSMPARVRAARAAVVSAGVRAGVRERTKPLVRSESVTVAQR